MEVPGVRFVRFATEETERPAPLRHLPCREKGWSSVLGLNEVERCARPLVRHPYEAPSGRTGARKPDSGGVRVLSPRAPHRAHPTETKGVSNRIAISALSVHPTR